MTELRKKQILRILLKNYSISQAFSRGAEIIIFENLQFKKPILDLGCGDGTFSEILFNKSKAAVAAGVDILPSVIELASKPRVYKDLKVADAAKLPFEDNFFFTIISNSSLEHMDNLDNVLFEANRVLKAGGKFIFLVAHAKTEDFYIDKIILKKLGLSSLARKTIKLRNKILNHRNLLDLKVWKNKLDKAGFSMEEDYYVGGGTNFGVVEFFQPTAVLSAITKRIFGRWVLPPREPVIYFVDRFLSKYLADKPTKTGPSLLIIARKNER